MPYKKKKVAMNSDYPIKEQAGYLLDGLSPTGGDLLEEREGQQ